jgi:transposase
MTIWVGIDVSKLHLDAGWLEDGKKVHRKVRNSKKGFAALLAEVPESAHFVMEATGTYYFNLALFLHQAHRFVAVVNPAQTKHHIKAELTRSKSDKSDAFSIAKFGEEKGPSAWNPHDREVYELRQLVVLDERLQQKIVQFENMFEAFVETDYHSAQALECLQEVIVQLKAKRTKVQKEMAKLADKLFPEQVQILSSIPGVGKSSAIKVMAEVGDFGRFDSSRKLVSFSGLSPTLKQSGTSVRSKGHISRMGGCRIRGTLYMCAMNALRCNDQCKAMWNRLEIKGKHGKIRMVAIMAKLLRQMWALITKNETYQPNLA